MLLKILEILQFLLLRSILDKSDQTNFTSTGWNAWSLAFCNLLINHSLSCFFPPGICSDNENIELYSLKIWYKFYNVLYHLSRCFKNEMFRDNGWYDWHYKEVTAHKSIKGSSLWKSQNKILGPYMIIILYEFGGPMWLHTHSAARKENIFMLNMFFQEQ